MRKHLLIILLATVLTFGFVGQAAPAYYIDWGYVGHEVIGGGQDSNRLVFTVSDDVTHERVPINIVDTVTLTDPNGAPVALSNLRFSTVYYLYEGYNTDTGQWYYDEQFTLEPSHGANIDVPLIVGTYNLLVKDIYGDEYDRDFEFNGLVNLPIISSSSFQIRQDPHYNLIWEWDINDCYYLNPSLETQARASIEILDQSGNMTGKLWVGLPTHMGRLFVPSNVLWKIFLAGKSWRFRIELRTTDSTNKTKSNYLAYEIDLFCECDFDGDGDVDGFDLVAYMIDPRGLPLEIFAEEFGRINCP